MPRACIPVEFSIEGEVLATDSGDERDMADFHSPRHNAFNGRVQAIVRAKQGARGSFSVIARSEGLPPARVCRVQK